MSVSSLESKIEEFVKGTELCDQDCLSSDYVRIAHMCAFMRDVMKVDIDEDDDSTTCESIVSEFVNKTKTASIDDNQAQDLVSLLSDMLALYAKYTKPRLSLVEEIRRLCRVGVDGKMIWSRLAADIEKLGIDIHSLPFQDWLVTLVLLDPIMTEFPSIPPTFWLSYARDIELNNREAHDAILNHNTKLLKSGEHVSYLTRPSFLNFAVNTTKPDHVITIRVKNGFENDVGLKTWPAGTVMAEYILDHSDVFDQKVCLEVGAGVGFTAAILGLYSQPSAIIATDYDQLTLNNLVSNLTQNIPHTMDERADESLSLAEFVESVTTTATNIVDVKTNVPVMVTQFDWTGDVNTFFHHANADILITCDTVYLPDYLPHLIRTFSAFMKTGKDGNTKNKVIYSCQTVRSPETWALYESLLDKAGFHKKQVKIMKSEISRFGTPLMLFNGECILYQLTM